MLILPIKNNTEENETMPTDQVKPESDVPEHPFKHKEESMKTTMSGSPNGSNVRDDIEYRIPAGKPPKERKSILELMNRAQLNEYISMVDVDFPVEELYTVRACDLEAKLEEGFPSLKIGHRRRLGVIILEGKKEFLKGKE